MIATDYIFGKKAAGAPPQEVVSPDFGYSFYQLNPLHTRFGVIRRTADSATREIGFVNGFMDNADAMAWLGGGAGTLVTWDDQFGGNHLQSSPGREALLYDNTGNLITHNGTPALKLASSNFDSINTIPWPNDFTFFSVVKSLSSATHLIFTSDLGSGVRIAQLVRAQFEFIPLSANVGTSIQLPTNPANMAVSVSHKSITNSKQILEINSLSAENYPMRTNTGDQILRMGSFQGSNYFGQAYISEAQVFLNTPEINYAVKNDIAARHSITF